MTGCIPLLLRSLPELNKDFDKAAFLECMELKIVKTNIISFYESIFEDSNLKLSRAT